MTLALSPDESARWWNPAGIDARIATKRHARALCRELRSPVEVLDADGRMLYRLAYDAQARLVEVSLDAGPG